MNKALQTIAQEISYRLVLEMEGEKVPGPVSILDPLLRHLATEVTKQLREGVSSEALLDGDLEARLQMVERKLANLAPVHEGSNDDTAETGGSFTNLKYAKSKYRNVESVLKYVEGEEDKGGVKLVIMNFND